MICAYFVRQPPSRDATWLDRWVEGLLSRMIRFYDRTLTFALDHRALMLIVFVATIVLTIGLYIKVPKGYFPQDDTGLIFGGTEASTDVSYEAMVDLQRKATEVVIADPAVAGVGSSVGPSPFSASVNRGRLFISLKPLNQRGNISTLQVVARLRAKLNQIPGIRTFMFPAQDLRVGGRQSDAQYQFTLWSADIDELQKWVPRVVDRVKRLPGIVDVTTDREQGGLQANITIDREAASRFGVRVQDIDNALNNAFSQRQISTIYGPRNQYRVILEVDAAYQRDPTDLAQIYVPGNGNAQVPLSAVTKYERGIAPLVVNHQGQFPSVTITYNLAPNALIEDVTRATRAGRCRNARSRRCPRRLLRRCTGLQAGGRSAALASSGGADCGLHRTRRSVREPCASFDHHLDVAIGRPGSAAGSRDFGHRTFGYCIHRHYSADRHRERRTAS